MHARPDDPRTPIRLGYHGSPHVATRIVRAAGRAADEIDLAVYDIADPFRALRAGDLDAMVVKFGLAEPDLRRGAELATDARAVVVGDGHPLAGRASVSIEELAAFDAFDRPGRLPAYIWDEVVPPATPAGRPIRRRHRVRTVPEMFALVAAGEAVHVSLASLADIAPPGVRVVPVHDLPPAPVSLAWRRDLDRDDVLAFVKDAEAGAA
ncbi:LysR substrate-binding domain-containing protein [Actinomadura fibrosa]|uniref:LysR substrate-binding domain-containing protein n=1 Tax=Actinomadura fibrosa TaxID=111802 RepID=A0ABW2XQF3_9ACTN|nr:LysR substrate-binding domain-containing protein [Actinomadura fibrosa]